MGTYLDAIATGESPRLHAARFKLAERGVERRLPVFERDMPVEATDRLSLLLDTIKDHRAEFANHGSIIRPTSLRRIADEARDLQSWVRSMQTTGIDDARRAAIAAQQAAGTPDDIARFEIHNALTRAHAILNLVNRFEGHDPASLLSLPAVSSLLKLAERHADTLGAAGPGQQQAAAELRSAIKAFTSNQAELAHMAANNPPVFAVDRPGLSRRGHLIAQARGRAQLDEIMARLEQHAAQLGMPSTVAAVAPEAATWLQQGARDAATAVDLLHQAKSAERYARYELADRAVATYAVAVDRARAHLKGGIHGVETIDALVGQNGIRSTHGIDDAVVGAQLLHDHLNSAAKTFTAKGAAAIAASGPAVDFARAVLPGRTNGLRAIGVHPTSEAAREAELHLQAAIAVIDPIRGHLPAERQVDLQLVRDLTEGGVALRSGTAITDVADALDRITSSLADAPLVVAAPAPWPQQHVRHLKSAIATLDEALAAWNPAADLAHAAGEVSNRGSFGGVIHGFGDVEFALLRARPALHATLSPDEFSIFEGLQRDLRRATLHMQAVDDAVGNSGTSAWPKLGELGKGQADLLFVRDVAAQRLAERQEAVKFAADWAGTSSVEPRTAAVADAAAAYVADAALPAHQVHASNVDSYLRSATLSKPVIHGTRSAESANSIMATGPDARKNRVAEFGTGFYTSLEGGLGYPQEIKLAIGSGRLAEFNSPEAFRVFAAGILKGETSADSTRRAFLDRGYDGAIIHGVTVQGATDDKTFVVMYDLRSIRVVAP